MADVVTENSASVEFLPDAADESGPAIVQLPAAETETCRGPATGEDTWYAPLRHRDFRFLLSGTVFMGTGQWIQQVTLGWLAYDMTGSSVLLGVLNGARMLPFLVMAPAAGVAADRVDRRRLLLSTQAFLLVTAVVMGMLVIRGQAEVWHLFLFTLITGVAWAFNEPLRQALLPSVVPRDDLACAVALNSTGSQITKMIAPTIGGLLIAWVGAGGNFLVQGVTYIGVFSMFYLMHVEPLPPRLRRSTPMADLADAVRYIAGDRLVLGLVLVSLFSRVFAMPYTTLMPVFQKDVYGVGPEGLGLLMAAPGVGAVAATLLLTSAARRLHHRGLILIGSLGLLGVLLIVFSQMNSLVPAMVALVGVGSFQMVFSVVSMMMLQMLVPDALRGRVLSIYMLDHALTPAGALMAGIATAYVGAQTTMAAMGLVVVVLAALVLRGVPRIRDPRL